MKKILFILTISTILFSCKKDEEPVIDGTLLAGEWELNTLDYSGSSTSQYMGQSITTTFNGSLYESDYSVIFNENPNTFESAGDYTIELTTNVNGITSSSKHLFSEILVPGNWEVIQNKIIVSNDQTTTQEATILELSNEKFIMVFEENQTVNQAGTEVKINVKGTYGFTRIP